MARMSSDKRRRMVQDDDDLENEDDDMDTDGDMDDDAEEEDDNDGEDDAPAPRRKMVMQKGVRTRSTRRVRATEEDEDEEDEEPIRKSVSSRSTRRRSRDEDEEPQETRLSIVSLFKGIGQQFAEALEPLQVQITSLQKRNQRLEKALNVQSDLIDEMVESQEKLTKSLAEVPEQSKLLKAMSERLDEEVRTTPARRKAPAPAPADTDEVEVLEKSTVGEESREGVLSIAQVQQMSSLIERAATLQNETFMDVPGYVDAADAFSLGMATPKHLETLKKGIERVAEESGQDPDLLNV